MEATNDERFLSPCGDVSILNAMALAFERFILTQTYTLFRNWQFNVSQRFFIYRIESIARPDALCYFPFESPLPTMWQLEGMRKQLDLKFDRF